MTTINKRQTLKSMVAALALAAGFAAPAAAQVTLRYAHVGSEGDIQYWYAEEFAKRVQARTEGRVKVQVFPNSQLGGAQETVDGVRSGAISLAHHEFASLSRLMPEMAAFAAPFIYRDGTHAMMATDPANSEIMKEMSEKLVKQANIRIVGRLYRGARQMTAKMAVYSPADLKDKRFRGVPLQLWTTMIKGMGAVPTPVEVAELPTALMTGMVIGQENPLTMINANKLYEVQSHVMLTGHMQNVLPVFINERSWQSIPEKDRAVVAAVAAEVGEETLKLGLEAEVKLIDELKKKGMTFITEKDGLKVDEFRKSVSAQVNTDFPTWAPIIARISAMK
ncbi:MAG: TRAP transporter substrate-binding protein [Bosea sp. (in: a-proteobacteria)]|jgi:tripartite ATP-independent transporter DctP family solute receptor|uniref:TRAP transporter substrate-binding protein n=1 Tax=unclassified Bosea (in: a-proteobacteria) TaxID=2653178 RepID=UPI0008557541|nr:MULTISPECIES: TRAP transporter substrate-binding protein [unclassified Bosea (in: a-proteobacteria)]AOG05013.1 TRAP transporter solute receptor, DctP family protein [Bosea sp. RAC05]MCZ8044796.1 TRAP transporter substrate-binding protein [Beijerinckiaceae bacterium]MDP3601092.1 TRAP transporter substrate-binding protein [Bosea sp. (in: a-proteobacteria)]